jgi:hypothetical protein
MNLEQVKEQLEAMSDKELFRYLRQLICQSLDELDHPSLETNEIMDMVFSECQIRGKERLYDKTYEAVTKNPDLCRVA